MTFSKKAGDSSSNRLYNLSFSNFSPQKMITNPSRTLTLSLSRSLCFFPSMNHRLNCRCSLPFFTSQLVFFAILFSFLPITVGFDSFFDFKTLYFFSFKNGADQYRAHRTNAKKVDDFVSHFSLHLSKLPVQSVSQPAPVQQAAQQQEQQPVDA